MQHRFNHFFKIDIFFYLNYQTFEKTSIAAPASKQRRIKCTVIQNLRIFQVASSLCAEGRGLQGSPEVLHQGLDLGDLCLLVVSTVLWRHSSLLLWRQSGNTGEPNICTLLFFLMFTPAFNSSSSFSRAICIRCQKSVWRTFLNTSTKLTGP